MRPAVAEFESLLENVVQEPKLAAMLTLGRRRKRGSLQRRGPLVTLEQGRTKSTTRQADLSLRFE